MSFLLPTIAVVLLIVYTTTTTDSVKVDPAVNDVKPSSTKGSSFPVKLEEEHLIPATGKPGGTATSTAAETPTWTPPPTAKMVSLSDVVNVHSSAEGSGCHEVKLRVSSKQKEAELTMDDVWEQIERDARPARSMRCAAVFNDPTAPLDVRNDCDRFRDSLKRAKAYSPHMRDSTRLLEHLHIPYDIIWVEMEPAAFVRWTPEGVSALFNHVNREQRRLSKRLLRGPLTPREVDEYNAQQELFDEFIGKVFSSLKDNPLQFNEVWEDLIFSSPVVRRTPEA